METCESHIISTGIDYVALNYSPQGDGNDEFNQAEKEAMEVALNYSPQGDGNLQEKQVYLQTLF